jgi:endo-1,4-beta-xylanase
VKGHPLLWGYAEAGGVPLWSKGQPEPAVQEQRVRDILARYRGKSEFWEVVNEPAHCPQVKIDPAYRWARAADPRGYLIINDYFVLADGQPAFFKLLQDALAAGVPFDGIGIQAHEPHPMRFPLETVQSTLDRYATLGKDLHITEFTPASGGEFITGSHLTGHWDEAAQADYAEKFYRVCFGHPAVVALTWWDLCDNGAWRKGGGLLRADLSPKPAYTALRKLICEEWRTRVAGKTDASGTFSLCGFYGRYAAKVQSPRGETRAEFEIKRGAENAVEIRLP